mmetsp:Transcript_25038/g.70072  ORF Transcript_25038/g.70072 Transcript_25038/m.70072 type:complete len:573 (+) Transcript_25038:74-1792(+)
MADTDGVKDMIAFIRHVQYDMEWKHLKAEDEDPWYEETVVVPLAKKLVDEGVRVGKNGDGGVVVKKAETFPWAAKPFVYHGVSPPKHKVGRLTFKHWVSLPRQIKAKGKDLKAMDVNGKSDPYIVISVGSPKWPLHFKSHVCKSTLNPDWGKLYEKRPRHFAPTPGNDFKSITFTIYDKDRIGQDEYMGQVRLDALEVQSRCFLSRKEEEFEYDVSGGGGKLKLKILAGLPNNLQDAFDRHIQCLEEFVRIHLCEGAKEALVNAPLLDNRKGYLTVEAGVHNLPVKNKVRVCMSTSLLEKTERKTEEAKASLSKPEKEKPYKTKAKSKKERHFQVSKEAFEEALANGGHTLSLWVEQESGERLGDKVEVPLEEFPLTKRVFPIGVEGEEGAPISIVVTADWYLHYKFGGDGNAWFFGKGEEFHPELTSEGNSEEDLRKEDKIACGFEKKIRVDRHGNIAGRNKTDGINETIRYSGTFKNGVLKCVEHFKDEDNVCEAYLEGDMLIERYYFPEEQDEEKKKKKEKNEAKAEKKRLKREAKGKSEEGCDDDDDDDPPFGVRLVLSKGKFLVFSE